jgi:hypothetical protein
MPALALVGVGVWHGGRVTASFNMKVCNMSCGKGRVRTQDLGYQTERYDHCATRQVEETFKFEDAFARQ